MAEQSGNLEWNISGGCLSKFINAKNGAEFASETFDVGQFTFQCKVYPNGRKKEQTGCVMLYFVLQTSLANKISKITVKARLYCPQTLCDWKHIQHLKKDNAGIGWHCKNMLLSEVKHKEAANQLSYIKFLCEISILRIEYKSNPQNIGINVYHKPVRMEQHSKYEWNISSKLLQSFQEAHNGKFYHSADYNHGCWCTSIAPNGASNKDVGNVKVGLQLLQLPASVSKIKCRFSISSNYEHIKCDGKKDFNYNSTFIAWSDGTLKTSNLLNIASQICFVVEIFVLKIYDEYNKEINKAHWSKYGIVSNEGDEAELSMNGNANGNAIHNPPNVMTKDISHESANGGLNGNDYSYNLLSPCTKTRASQRKNTRMFSANNNKNEVNNSNQANHSNENSSSGQFIVTNPEALTHSENGSNPNVVDNGSNNNNKAMPLQIAKSTSYTGTDPKSKTNHHEPLSGQSSYDLQHNLALLHSTNSKMNEIQCKMEEFESSRCEDKQHLISIEQSILSLMQTTNQAQQQQFDQNSILKQCITDLSSCMQRLTNEVVFMKSKVKSMENQISVQSQQISQFEEEKEKKKESAHPMHRHSLESATSTKHRRHSAKNSHFRKSKSRQRDSTKSKSKSNNKEKMKVDTGNMAPDLVAWIQHECGFPQYVTLFAENGYETLDIVKEMTKVELEEIGIVLKGHQFKIMKEIQKLDLYRKHVRNGGNGNKLDILHVANYLTPVQSPAASSDTTTTCTNVDDLRLIPPVSPSLDSNRSRRNLKSMGHLHHPDSMNIQQPQQQQRQYYQHAHSRTQQFAASFRRKSKQQSMNMTLNMNMNMVKNNGGNNDNEEDMSPQQETTQTNGDNQQSQMQNGLAVKQKETENGGALTPMDEDGGDSSTDTNSPSYQSTAISDTSYATSATHTTATTAGYMQYQQHQPFHQQQTMTLKNGGGPNAILMRSPKHIGHLSSHFNYGALNSGNNRAAANGYSPQGPAPKSYHMSTMSNIWQCRECNNTNVNTFDKCEHCGFPVGYKL